jgi:hypothetical protein
MQLTGSKDGGWVYTGGHPGSKMEIPDILAFDDKKLVEFEARRGYSVI